MMGVSLAFGLSKVNDGEHMRLRDQPSQNQYAIINSQKVPIPLGLCIQVHSAYLKHVK